MIIILLTKLTCFRKFFILYISRSSAFSCCNLDTHIVFQSFRAILLLKASEISFFTQGLCIFPILSIIALNFPKSNVQRNLFQNIFKEIGNVLRILTYFNVIVAMILALVFVVFTALLLNMFIKLFYIRGIFIYSQLSFVFFCVLFLGFFIISYLLFFSCLCIALVSLC